MKFQSSLIVLVSLVSAALSDSVLVNDVRTFTLQTTTLVNDISAYPTSGLSGALAIHSDFARLGHTIDKSTNELAGVTEEDADTILDILQSAFRSTIINALEAIGAQAPAWTDLPGGQALILADLSSLNASTLNFGKEFIADAPTDSIASAAAEVQENIRAAFNSAIAAYSP